MTIDSILSSFDSLIFQPEDIIAHSANLGLYGAVISVITGIVYMMYGWQIFRVMVAILFAFIGFYAGSFIGNFFGWAMFGGVVMSILFAAGSLPLMRLATGIIIALVSASLAGYLWHISDFPEKYTLACGAVGLILGGLCGFYIFKLAVMAYTSLLGSSIVLTGFYGFSSVVSQSQSSAQDGVPIEMINLPMNLPMPIMLAILTIAGLLIQIKIHGISDGESKKSKS